MYAPMETLNLKPIEKGENRLCQKAVSQFLLCRCGLRQCGQLSAPVRYYEQAINSHKKVHTRITKYSVHRYGLDKSLFLYLPLLIITLARTVSIFLF